MFSESITDSENEGIASMVKSERSHTSQFFNGQFC